MKRLLGWIAAAGDRVNPIAVKEFRQAVRSRLVVAVLMLFLVVDLLVLGGHLLTTPEAGVSTEGGRNVFMFLLSVLLVTCVGFVPVYSGVRLSLERNDVNLDLLYITTISPGAIVRGKYFTAMALTLLIFSASAPFVVLTYLLRGIDLPTIFYLLAIALLVCAVANAMGIFAGCVPGSWFMRGLVGLGMLILLIYVIAGMLRYVQYSVMFGGFPGATGGWQFWTGFGTTVLMALLGIGLLHVMSVALVSPKAFNRMLIPRIYVTSCWAVAGAVMAWWNWNAMGSEMLAVWVYLSAVLFSGLAVLALGERDTWSRRVRRTIPRNPLLRVFAFLLYTGSAGGILWCTLMFAATLYVGYAWSGLAAGFPRARPSSAELFTNLTIFYGYVLCYCLTTAFLRTVALKNVPTVYLPVAAILLGVALSVGPYLMGFFVTDSRAWRYDPAEYLLGSPLILTEVHRNVEAIVGPFLIGWTLLGVVGSSLWFFGQWRRFTPYRAEEGSGFRVQGSGIQSRAVSAREGIGD